MLGVAVAVALTHVLSYLFATKPTDPLTLAVVTIAFVVTAPWRVSAGVARDDRRSDDCAAGRVTIGVVLARIRAEELNRALTALLARDKSSAQVPSMAAPCPQPGLEQALAELRALDPGTFPKP